MAQQVDELPTISLKLIGRNPLLMHSDRGVNILDPLVKEKKAVTGKRKKTDEDQEIIARLEWEISMYFDEKIGPHIPARCIEASIVEGAKLEKRGKDVSRGLQVISDPCKLEYKGPRDFEKMWAAKKFADIRSVGQQQARIMRCRPIFHDWSAECTIAYDSEVWNAGDIVRIAAKAGKYCGIGDYRTRFGRFDIEVLKHS